MHCMSCSITMLADGGTEQLVKGNSSQPMTCHHRYMLGVKSEIYTHTTVRHAVINHCDYWLLDGETR